MKQENNIFKQPAGILPTEIPGVFKKIAPTLQGRLRLNQVIGYLLAQK